MEVIKSILLGGLPTFVISFAMVFLAIKRGYVEIDEDLAELNKRKKLAKKEKTEFSVNPIHNKWLFFGGGYYGIMALGTYAHVEFIEIYDFFRNFTSIQNFIDQISIGAIIGLVIESFMNIIPAFTWFLYWPKVIVMQSGWVWLAVSYAGYYLGEIVAKFYYKTKVSDKN